MDILNWNKLSDKDKERLKRSRELVFIAGPVSMSNKRLKQIEADLTDTNILFGCLKDDQIPELEGSLQFSPLKLEALAKGLGRNSKVTILEHFHKDLKYIIKELKPSKVIFVNGSWNGQIHYRSEYWKAIDVGAKIELLSPFTSETEAKRYTKVIENKYKKIKLYSERKKYTEREIFQIINRKMKQSWDWIGRPTGVLVKNRKILALEHNRVVLYQAYQMHHGSIREKKQIPAQEMIETQLTNHAESEVLEYARRNKINLKGTTLYMNIFPCPVCAKMLSRTEIESIVYSHDHNLANDIGYRVLEKSGKKIKRVVT